eukprot:CAMPEP_0116120926 /NCGR_PEP_ID=MMETSP0329-20121206/3431_1 /TAXON_ID=697910 /ORGANISM="Pseudo-nitzschia arenysensis, Strain B593" /LENGTH=1440 /DNA_ID=CAMNT_0003614719 /DNA_START=72 /DNA_END=4394 /DNA_ORIENTATION=-
MSLEAVWDLRIRIGAGGSSGQSSDGRTPLLPYSPRSTCVFAAPPPPAAVDTNNIGNSTNPFDDATPSSIGGNSSSQPPTPRGVVFGSEEGSLHYRSYPSPLTDGSSSDGSSNHHGSFGTIGNSPSRHRNTSSMTNPNTPRPALGVTPSGRPPANMPRSYYPVDLPSKSLPGPVVDVIPSSSFGSSSLAQSNTGRRNQRQRQQPTSQPGVFLVMVDDNKGSNKQGGAYAASLVTLQNGAFAKLNTNNSNANSAAVNPRFHLPSRVSCATYHERCGFVVCGGKRIFSVPICQFPDEGGAMSRMTGGSNTNSGKSHRNSQQTTVDFSGTVLPPPGVRGGQDSMVVTSNGFVAVVAVGNAVYGVPGIEVDVSSSSTPSVARDSNPGSMASSPAHTKILSFGQSSQIHPVILVDVQDRSVHDEWSTLLVCNGRECAVVDVHHDALHHSVSAGTPRNGTANTAAPILSAAASWPFVALLTSDGLVSVRGTSCLAIPLKTLEVGTRPNDFFTLRSFLGGNSDGGFGGMTPNAGRHYFHQQQQQYGRDPYGTNNNFNFDEEGGSSSSNNNNALPWILSMSYSGQAKLLKCKADTQQDLADRLMRISIDAFGGNGFPRNQLAEALSASFTATSYAGPEPTSQSRNLLKQYLEAALGLAEFESGAAPGWPTTAPLKSRNKDTPFGSPPRRGYNAFQQQQQYTSPRLGGGNTFDSEDTANSAKSKNSSEFPPVITDSSPNALLTATALLCLVCIQLSPSPKGSLAVRAARECASKIGVVYFDDNEGMSHPGISQASISVNQIVAERLLKEASSKTMSLLNRTNNSRDGRSTGQAQAGILMDFVEAATWLLRSCGKHERAIDVLYQRHQQHRAPESARQPVGFWSQIKYESYTAAHLSELWSTQKSAACELVLRSSATARLLETNPQLGLSIFTVNHPQNANQWRKTSDHDDPLAHPSHPPKVLKLLKSIKPVKGYDQRLKRDYSDAKEEFEIEDERAGILPLESGRALAVAYLESAIGISTNRPEEDEFDLLDKSMEYAENLIADFHDELCFLLLEGVISERGDNQHDSTSVDGDVTLLGRIYRQKLRHFLRWPLAKIRSERLLDTLPRSFLQEKALVLGRLGRHEEALKILYCNCKSMDLALEYCDMLHGRRKNKIEKERARLAADSLLDDRANDELDDRFQKENAYLPLVRVALESDPDKKRGISSAIQILAMRRGDIDRSAALRLLPNNLPVSAVARPFLIPALVDSESQTRRLKVVSSLLRAKHTALKHQLTDAQLKAQSSLYVVPQFKSMNLGPLLHSTKPFKARPSSSASPTFPDVTIVKHFFARHLIIQAKVNNNSLAVEGRALGNIAFVVAESSEDAIQPASNSAQVPIKVLPYNTTGSAWCVLVAAPSRMEGTAILTCELRYTVLGVDATSGTPLSFGQGATMGRTFVEEIQDVEVFASHFS